MTVQDMKQFLDQVHPNAEFKVDTQKKPVELRDVAVSLVEQIQKRSQFRKTAP